MGLELQLATKPDTAATVSRESGTLEETLPPLLHPRQGKTTSVFRTHKPADRSANDMRNQALGLAGEMAVLEYERGLLTDGGREDLAEKVRHVSRIEGDGAGYDILSYTVDGEEKYIEVKTTTGGYESSFYMTSNEVAFSEQHQDAYYLYRVYGFDAREKSGKFYVVRGGIQSSFYMTPVEYRVSLT